MSMRPRTEMHPKQLGSNAQNLVCVPVTSSDSTEIAFKDRANKLSIAL